MIKKLYYKIAVMISAFKTLYPGYKFVYINITLFVIGLHPEPYSRISGITPYGVISPGLPMPLLATENLPLIR